MEQSTDQATTTAMEFTKSVTKKWPDRLTGRAACLACGQYLKTEFEKFSDQTFLESFSIHPGSFLGYIRINVALYVLSLISLYFDQYILAMVFSVLATVIMIAQFMLYKPFVDPFFKKRKGQNIIGTIEQKGEVKQQIIVSAHHDSAHIFNFLENHAPWYSARILLGIFFQSLMLLITLLLSAVYILGIDWPIFNDFALGLFSAGLLFVIPLWFFYQNKGTPGAGDNMICTAVAMEIGKRFSNKKNGYDLKHTRLIIASWDAEECGLRGARAYVDKHRSTLQNIKTYNYNLECLYDFDSLCLLTSDLNGFVPLSNKMVEEVRQVGHELGYQLVPKKFPVLAGGTDAAEMAKAGVEATCLAGMPFDTYGSEPAYHTTRDTIDAVDPRAVRAAIDIGAAYIQFKDKQL